jgi:alkanesulfonate monooxygenase SsuD/methylene tetrahydromethanopterin reductase-like flavin-dependent oxidoreductase (luciferase family)
MRFVMLTEGDTPAGMTHYHRYMEVVDEALLAEKVGFDGWGSSEQHVAIGGASISAPEVLYPYLMAKTSRLQFVHAVTLLPTRINHPLRVAERVATADILSNGRVELGTGRGNTTLALRAFEVAANDNKAQWDEGIELIRRAFLDDPFTFEGEYYKIPPRSLTPKPVQRPHPPLSVAATSPDSHQQAGEKGIGVMSAPSFMGFDFLQNALKIYDETFSATTHSDPAYYHKTAAIIGGVHCAETTAQARKEALPMLKYAQLSVGGFERLSKLSQDYAYMGAVKDVDFHDEGYMYGDSAGFVVGDPDECIRQIRVYEEMGVDTITMRMDSIPHDQLMRSIEMFGKYVIPHFKSPDRVVRSADDVLADIRAARPKHQEELRRKFGIEAGDM